MSEVLFLAGVLGVLPGLANAQPKVVVPEGGPVMGVLTPDGREFRGIPYAAPPVGDLRWQPPSPAQPWTGLLDGSQFGSSCPQPATPFGTASIDEDCLYLNVYTPPVTTPVAGQSNPVMVWLHPGAFQYGEGDAQDPRTLVQHGVVVVTLNYRLGALGWLAHPALTAESPDATSGNYGLMDQQAALRWVQQNIAVFGGDPDNVTIFGESAGGVSVHAHLVSPHSAGLFHRAIAQSGAYSLVQPALAVAESEGVAYATAVGCSDQDLECLRAVPVTTLLANQSTSPSAYLPRVDGEILPLPVRTAFATGAFNRVPVIEGSTHDEFTLFVASLFVLRGIPVNEATYFTLIETVLGAPQGTGAFFAAQYPLEDYGGSHALALAAIGTDAAFACNTVAAASLLAPYVAVWAYEFDDSDAPMTALPPAGFPYGAYHGSELHYLFDTDASLDTQQQQLAESMQSYWTDFAHSGNPNGAATPTWNPLQVSGSYQLLTPPTPVPYSAGAFAADHKCSFWASVAGG